MFVIADGVDGVMCNREWAEGANALGRSAHASDASEAETSRKNILEASINKGRTAR